MVCLPVCATAAVFKTEKINMHLDGTDISIEMNYDHIRLWFCSGGACGTYTKFLNLTLRILVWGEFTA